jgi:hypothetical protein
MSSVAAVTAQLASTFSASSDGDPGPDQVEQMEPFGLVELPGTGNGVC